MFTIINLEFCDLLLFSVLLNIIMYVFLLTQKSRQSHSTKLFRDFILSVAVAGAFEAAGWLLAIPGDTDARPFYYLSNALFFATNLLPVALGLRYLDYVITFSEEKNRKRLFLFLVPVYMNAAFVLVNLFSNGFLFSIDPANTYHRGIAVYIGNATTILFTLIVVIGFFRNKQMITGRITQIILALTLLPVTGAVLQTVFYGASVSIPAYTLGIFITFLLMERNELLKDPLTLLNSRIQMENRLQYKLKAQEPFTAMMIDVDGFKNINDVYGHTVGDEVLKDVSKILLSCANFEDFVCRFGGDEFFVILESPRDIGCSYIRRIDQVLKEYSQKHAFSTTLSFGCVYVSDTGKYDVEALVRTTDERMYKDKVSRKIECAH